MLLSAHVPWRFPFGKLYSQHACSPQACNSDDLWITYALILLGWISVWHIDLGSFMHHSDRPFRIRIRYRIDPNTQSGVGCAIWERFLFINVKNTLSLLTRRYSQASKLSCSRAHLFVFIRTSPVVALLNAIFETTFKLYCKSRADIESGFK